MDSTRTVNKSDRDKLLSLHAGGFGGPSSWIH